MNKAAKIDKTAEGWSWNPFSADYAPGGPVAKQLVARQEAVNKATDAHSSAVNNEMVNALIGLGVLGVGAGLTGTKLYNLVNRFNKPKDKYTKFGPGPRGVDEKEKIASELTQKILDAISYVPNRISEAWNSAPAFSTLTQNQQAAYMPAALLTAGLGIYGGHSLARAIEDKKKKEDLEIALEEARQDYQRALTGKRAEDLSAAFNNYKQATENRTKTALVGAAATTADYLAEPLRWVGLLPAYATAVLGTGLLSGKMTYDWTRERSKDKALERARRSRARMEESSPLYIDPAQLEAIKALHQKEVDKIKQQAVV